MAVLIRLLRSKKYYSTKYKNKISPLITSNLLLKMDNNFSGIVEK